MSFSTELIKGTLRTIILKLLSDHGKLYGYELTQKAKEMTGGKIQITEGALYPTLHALEREGLLVTEVEYIGKRVRKYYYLSESGSAASSQKISELQDFINTIGLLLDLKTFTV
ncbi:MAG: PadR family transcriptional regulator [Bacteroidetes bacterium]|nr:PadR family transcriptional regulator [Bacteroidota bacterium]MBS1739532.1 PadR family transcriptional regulator [Bacteroidota bacterium]MBS1777433.1 PadR family transcriptional regulator [Bacteroidota bacterium]